MEIENILLDKIVEDRSQPRRNHNEESLQGLADSIRQHGMLQPITVTPITDTDQYRIITGERRWRAASMARLQQVPCIVKQIVEEERLTEQLIENLQREDLQPLEKAKAVQIIKETMNLTNREIARRLGLSERTIGYMLDILTLPEEIGEAVVSRPNRPSEGQITEKHARFLKQLNDEPELQSAIAEKVRKDRLTGEDTGKFVRAMKNNPTHAEEILNRSADHLSDFFGDVRGEMSKDASVLQAPAHNASDASLQLLALLPALSNIIPSSLTPSELREVDDALSLIQASLEKLKSACRARLKQLN